MDFAVHQEWGIITPVISLQNYKIYKLLCGVFVFGKP